MNVGIIGCGLIGQKRAKFLKPDQILGCTDPQASRAEQLAQSFPRCRIYADWQSLISDPEIQIVIIATPHNIQAEITLAAVSNKKHVLVEKPAGLKSAELIPAIEMAKKNKVLVRVGFNHRYHRAFQQAKKIVAAGELGELMYVRARYGHGGRIGYEKEWRAIPEISGGGELIDQGVHIIDLSRWFLGDLPLVSGFSHTYYWQMPVEDNGFLILKNASQQVAFLHASCSEWKNTFSFEIYGKKGKLHIDGLGGSYGVERLCHYHMLPEMGPPETTIFEYPMADNSWEVEFAEFLDDIQLGRECFPNLRDAYHALKTVETIYDLSKNNFGFADISKKKETVKVSL